jgi:hypothetical protein
VEDFIVNVFSKKMKIFKKIKNFIKFFKNEIFRNFYFTYCVALDIRELNSNFSSKMFFRELSSRSSISSSYLLTKKIKNLKQNIEKFEKIQKFAKK